MFGSTEKIGIDIITINVGIMSVIIIYYVIGIDSGQIDPYNLISNFIFVSVLFLEIKFYIFL